MSEETPGSKRGYIMELEDGGNDGLDLVGAGKGQPVSVIAGASRLDPPLVRIIFSRDSSAAEVADSIKAIADEYHVNLAKWHENGGS